MFTHEELISRGFVKFEGTIYSKNITYPGYYIMVDPISMKRNLVWLDINDEPVLLPNCRTLADLDQLIKLFTV